jgi:PKHD-type hydroxylase
VARYYSWDNIIPKSECERIIDDCKSDLGEIAQVGDGVGGSIVDKYRKTNIRWIDNSKLIAKLIYGFVHEANDLFFHYDISNHDQIQFGEYTVGGHYNYHQDTVTLDSGIETSPIRKLSVSVLLSDPKDFEGGEFVMYNGGKEPLKPLKGQGSIIVFASSDFHAVEPVTFGVRHSLVMWATGPLFK